MSEHAGALFLDEPLDTSNRTAWPPRIIASDVFAIAPRLLLQHASEVQHGGVDNATC